jgi:hypothetical protein
VEQRFIGPAQLIKVRCPWQYGFAAEHFAKNAPKDGYVSIRMVCLKEYSIGEELNAPEIPKMSTSLP